jgi:hypothetical protein
MKSETILVWSGNEMRGLGDILKTPPLSSRFIFNETRIIVQRTDTLGKSTYVDMMASSVPYDIPF